MLLRALREPRDGILGLSYPAACRVCDGAIESWDDGVACAACWEDPAITEIIRGEVCSKCGAPTRRAGFRASSSDEQAEPCLAENESRTCRQCRSLPFSAARACGTYSGALEASILFLKSQPHLCRRLRELIRRTFLRHRAALESDLIIPVPLHRLRQRARGFNQAEIIARVVSRNFEMPLDDGSLLRVRSTERHRAGVDSIDRTESVEGAFEVARPRLIEGSSLLIVDDVMTTGSTISAMAGTLLEAGARRIAVLTVARVAGEPLPVRPR
ncbi:MAG: phosphoribosyltransferase family protein [Acidobacteriota bacterium]